MPITQARIAELAEIARQMRIDVLKMLTQAGSGHTGGSLSAVDIICTLYFHHMNYKADDPKWRDRDKFVLSKGHGAPALYSALARAGFFCRDELMKLRQHKCMLQGHPYSPSTPGVEASTGSLGQGLSVSNGLALAARLDGLKSRVYVLLGDGETQEGQVWEAAMSSAHYKLDNLCAFIDNNGLRREGATAVRMSVGPRADKWRAFGWSVQEIDGHDFGQIVDALEQAGKVSGKPSMIIARTVKGKGVSFFEGKVEYHGLAPKPDELVRALVELGAN